MTILRKIENAIVIRLHRIKFRMSWRNRNRIDKFLKWLRDDCNFIFDGLKPCRILGRQEFKEIDDDRYYDMLELYVVNIITRRKYRITEFE